MCLYAHTILNLGKIKCKEKVVVQVIKYDRFFMTLKKKNISQNKLMRDYGVDNAQLHRLRKNMVIKTVTIDNLCRILNCNVEDIMEYIPDEQEQPE